MKFYHIIIFVISFCSLIIATETGTMIKADSTGQIIRSDTVLTENVKVDVVKDTVLIVKDTLSRSDSTDQTEILDSLAQSIDSTGNRQQMVESAIVVEGILIDKVTGNPPDDSLVIKIDSAVVSADSEGAFSLPVLKRAYYTISILSRKYQPLQKTVLFVDGKLNYFLTLQLERSLDTAKNNAIQVRDTSTIPWTISGTVIDSRFDLAIESDSIVLFFDGDTVKITENANFVVSTYYSGDHTFYLTIPGYHSVTQAVKLEEIEKQLYLIIPTTVLSKAITRREITVSAQHLPVHRSAQLSKVDIARKEMQKTAATFNDPMRVLQTLPGVASESDASARPIVRGGDVNEARVFLDGISLLQPYHFGGARSIFNQQSLNVMSLYKTGFPAELHNAQSALIEAGSRMPSDEKVAFEFDINPLQYSTYLGVPLFKGKAGLSFSSQGSFYEQISKGVIRIVDAFKKEDLTNVIKSFNLPDYKDFSVGLAVVPSSKLKFFFNEIYNTDKTKFLSIDSVVDVSYKYYTYDNQGNRILDTVVTIEEPFGGWSYANSAKFIPGKYYDGKPEYGKPRLDIDTIVDYRSKFNVLYGKTQYIASENLLFNTTVAWQKRWWDLNFPTLSDIFDTALYDININQFNLNSGLVYSGIDNHIIKTGVQLDYTNASYNVFIVRYLHHMIAEGSTNFVDFWGPVNGDTAIVLKGDDDLMNTIMDRIFVAYNGKRDFINAAFYCSDGWDISKQLHLDAGTRVEYSQADHATLFSPRLTLKYNYSEKIELLGSIGLYTQNNYDIGAICLSEELKPEKVWHAVFGTEVQLLPWLVYKIDAYGKYYFDLTSEIIDNVKTPTAEEIEKYIVKNYPLRYLDTLRESEYQKIVMKALYELNRYRTRYINEGKGYAYGIENLLRFNPTDFWFGWISLTWGQSFRQRKEGWRVHPFPLDRPLMISVNNFYRLPRKYEISCKYRYMTGLPYTSMTQTPDYVRIGNFNDKRYAAYHRLDFKFSKGFSIRNGKGNFYTEIWNAMNAPNFFALDSKTKKGVTFSTNIPVTSLFFGFDFVY